MSASLSAARQRARLGLVLIALLAAGGVAVGWLLPPAYSWTFDRARAVLDPIVMTALGICLVYLQVVRRRVTVVATLLCACFFIAAALAIWGKSR